jgi:Calcineurin-like phosphoesterase
MSRFCLVATADNHFCERIRFSDCIRVHQFVAEVARDAQADVVVSAGDMFEEESTPRERDAAADFVTAVTETCPFVGVRGNHDADLDPEIFRRLATKHPIIFETGADVHRVGSAMIAAVAWPERATILAAAGSIGAAELGIREALQAVFRHLGAQLAQHDGPRIGLGHLMIDGSVASTGQPLLGMPINVSLEDLALLNAHLGVAGHIHARQRWELSRGGIWLYPGGPFRTAHGQLEPKSIVVAVFEGQALVSLEEVETPCAPMTDLDAAWSTDFGGSLVMPSHGDLRGHEVRLTYNVAADQQGVANAFARELRDRMLAAGVKAVALEPVIIVETRARAPEVAAASTFRSKLEAHWGSIGFDPGDRREALLEKAELLEREARDVA